MAPGLLQTIPALYTIYFMWQWMKMTVGLNNTAEWWPQTCFKEFEHCIVTYKVGQLWPNSEESYGKLEQIQQVVVSPVRHDERGSACAMSLRCETHRTLHRTHRAHRARQRVQRFRAMYTLSEGRQGRGKKNTLKWETFVHASSPLPPR